MITRSSRHHHQRQRQLFFFEFVDDEFAVFLEFVVFVSFSFSQAMQLLLPCDRSLFSQISFAGQKILCGQFNFWLSSFPKFYIYKVLVKWFPRFYKFKGKINQKSS